MSPSLKLLGIKKAKGMYAQASAQSRRVDGQRELSSVYEGKIVSVIRVKRANEPTGNLPSHSYHQQQRQKKRKINLKAAPNYRQRRN